MLISEQVKVFEKHNYVLNFQLQVYKLSSYSKFLSVIIQHNPIVKTLIDKLK